MGSAMGNLSSENPQWHLFLILGFVLILQSFIKWETGIDLNGKDLLSGPWNSVSFSRGVFGLCGGLFVYFAWFRWKFGIKGVVPTLEIWDNPKVALRKLLISGITVIILGNIIGNYFSNISPGPAGLLLTLIGSLMCIQSGYIWLITEGPLGEEE